MDNNEKITITPHYLDGVLIITQEDYNRLKEERKNRPADYYDIIDTIYDTPDIELDDDWI